MPKKLKRMRVETMKLGLISQGEGRPVPKSYAEALLRGFREANGGCTEDYWFSYDLKTMEGSFGFYRGIGRSRSDEKLLIPFTAKVTLGHPYYPKQKSEENTHSAEQKDATVSVVPLRAVEGGGAA